MIKTLLIFLFWDAQDMNSDLKKTRIRGKLKQTVTSASQSKR